MKHFAVLMIVGYLCLLRLEATSAVVGLYAPDRYEGIPNMCMLPMDFGYCRAKVKRFYFDPHRMKCSMFYWGGCAGNINNFKSLDECNKFCLDGVYEGDAAGEDISQPSFRERQMNRNSDRLLYVDDNNAPSVTKAYKLSESGKKT